MRISKCIVAAVGLLIVPQLAHSTLITNTRPEIAQMAGLWEVDTIQISTLANAQYPLIGGGTSIWQYIYASTGASSDGDLHHALAIDSAGTGRTGNNIGNSPIVAEIVNVSASQISTVTSLSAANNHRVVPRGIFRFYTEHAGEIHFEIHPITAHLTNSGGAFVVAADLHSSITNDAYARHGYAISTLQQLVDGTITMTATMMADNNRVILNYPTGAGAATMNYPEYDGRVVQTLTNDLCGPYFTFIPTNAASPPGGAISNARVMRCRIVTNTLAASIAAGLVSNMAVNVNALNRVDMLVLSNTVASLSANQSTNFVRPIEFITLGLKTLEPVSPPTATFSGSPTNGPVPLTVTFTDSSTGSITNRSWSFGDGGTSNTTATSLQYTYNVAGTNTVTLTVNGLGGSGASIRTNYIVVSSSTPLTPFESWQIQYFGSTNSPDAAPDADPDGDGQNGQAEFLSGSDPTNSASAFRIVSVTQETTNVVVTWQTVGGRTNILQATGGDVDGGYNTNGFADVGGQLIIPGSAEILTNQTDWSGATNVPSQYYRIRLVP